MESRTQPRLSLSRFSLNSVLRRHKRTRSLPEPPALLKNSCESVASTCPSVDAKTDACQWKKVSSAIGEIQETLAANDKVGGVGKRSYGSAMKLERYSSQLGLSQTEKILKVCPCFMVADLLIQGVLIITDRHVCFYSSIFGHRRNRKIKFEDIEQIGKEKVYALFPTGISVRTGAEKVTFSSATSRDKLLKLLQEQCRKFSSVRTSGGQGSQTEKEASITGSNEINTQSPDTISGDVLMASEGEDHMEQSHQVQFGAAEDDASVLVASVGSLELDSIADWENRSQPIETSNCQPVSHLVATAGELSAAACTDAGKSSTCNGIVLSKTALSVIAIILVFCGLFVYAFYLTCWLGEIEHQILVVASTTSTQIHGAKTYHYSQLSSQIGIVSSAVDDLQNKIVHMRTVLRSLLMYSRQTTAEIKDKLNHSEFRMNLIVAS